MALRVGVIPPSESPGHLDVGGVQELGPHAKPVKNTAILALDGLVDGVGLGKLDEGAGGPVLLVEQINVDNLTIRADNVVDV